jgi:ubiquinone/menaquinone biosynthesis C-methylase UbiE
VVRAAEIWERWFVHAVLEPALGRGRARRRVAELAEIRDRIIREATIAPMADVLDLGCGSGLLTYPAAEEAGSAVGVDADSAMLVQAAAVPAVGAEFACADAGALPFPDASFDVVLWRGLLAYAPAREEILREVLRVLRPEGRLCFSESLAAEMDVPLRNSSASQVWGALKEIQAAALGERALERERLRTLVEGAGFDEVRVQVERRRTDLEDERAVREVFQDAIGGSLPLASLWIEAGVPDPVVKTFLDTLIAETPTRIETPEGYVTATCPRSAT